MKIEILNKMLREKEELYYKTELVLNQILGQIRALKELIEIESKSAIEKEVT